MSQKFKFIFDMKDWRSGAFCTHPEEDYGHGEGSTYMYNEDTGLSCCLGLLSIQCGVDKEVLDFCPNPLGASENSDLYSTHPVLKKLIDGRSDSYITDALIAMNDDLRALPRERAEKIASYMREHLDIDVEIVE